MTDTYLLNLAKRVERLTGPCRETDLVIHLALCPDSDIAKMMQNRRGLDGKEGYAWEISGGSVVYERWTTDGRCPHNGGYPLLMFTGLRDAAMLLLLEWMSIETCESAAPSSSPEFKFTRCRIWDWRRGPLAIDPTNETRVEGNRPLPLNMCAAILRARAASESGR